LVVTPPITANSWLQSNWQASPGAKTIGTNALATPVDRAARHRFA